MKELKNLVNALLDQIDKSDFVDSHGHSAKSLKAVFDLMNFLAIDTVNQESSAVPTQEPLITDDSATMICRLVQALRKAAPDNTLTEKAMDYLRRAGFIGDVLREIPVQEMNALTEMEARKDAAYLERNQVVAALAKCFLSGITKTDIEGWSEDWHNCVYIDLPTGQASWHYHDSQAYLFADLPAYSGKRDGHTTEEKYARIARLQPAQEPVKQKADSGWVSAEVISSTGFRHHQLIKM